MWAFFAGCLTGFLGVVAMVFIIVKTVLNHVAAIIEDRFPVLAERIDVAVEVEEGE